MINLVFVLVSVFAAAYSVIATVLVLAHGRRRAAPAGVAPPVSILKPLSGDDGHLYDNLTTFCRQDYASFEIICGVRHAGDAAVAVVERLMREFPSVEIKLIVDDRTIGANLKVSNLANLVRYAKHETLVVADADMRVTPDYLDVVVGALARPDVGLVTCLYRGMAGPGLASRLGAMFVNEWFFPAALVANRVEGLRHAFGATIACRRDTLDAVGGFEAIAAHLADDYLLGRLVHRRGYRVVLAPYLVDDVIADTSLRQLLVHELRWARTFRTLRPASYFCSLFTLGVPISLAWYVATGGYSVAGYAVVGQLALRYLGRLATGRVMGEAVRTSDALLIVIRDVLSFTLVIVSFFGRTVRWNDATLYVHPDGRVERKGGDAA